jgi:hypothetical protein
MESNGLVASDINRAQMDPARTIPMVLNSSQINPTTVYKCPGCKTGGTNPCGCQTSSNEELNFITTDYSGLTRRVGNSNEHLSTVGSGSVFHIV